MWMLGTGLPDSSQFQNKMLDLANCGMARGYILFHGESPIAYLFCPAKDDILFYQYVGYDPGYKRWSPGTVLQYMVLERLFDESKFRLLDFTEGEGPHNEFFSTESTLCADIYYFRRTFRNFLLLSFLRSRLNDFRIDKGGLWDRVSEFEIEG